MLDYLISLLNFTVDGTTYNLITTPWNYIIQWANTYAASSNNGAYSTGLRDAYEILAKLGIASAALVVVLIIVCCWFVYKIASGFTGWFRFR